MVIKRLFAIIITVMLVTMLCLVSVSADGESTLTHSESGITATGVFPDITTLYVTGERVKDNPLCEQMYVLTFMVTCDHEDADADTYDGYNGVTISIPYDKKGMSVIGFDVEGNPVDTKAEYKSGHYTFTTNNIGDGHYWITEQKLTCVEKPIKFQKLEDKSSGVVVKGYFPDDSYLLVRDITKLVVDQEVTKHPALYYDIKVYNQFKVVSTDKTLNVQIPHKSKSHKPLMEMTMEQIQKLTDKEDDPEINSFDRRYIDVKAEYRNGKFIYDASRVGTICIASADYYKDMGGGTKRATPPTENIKPFSEPINLAPIIAIIAAGAFVVVIGAYVVLSVKRGRAIN